MTNVRAWKGSGWECNMRVTLTLLGMWENVREWPHTFQSGLPLWELESVWIPKSSKNDLKCKNLLDWGFFYNIGNIVRLICIKWDLMIHLSTHNTSYGQKKGWESKCQFDFRPLEVGNRLEWRVCMWCAIYIWKYLYKGYNFASDLTSIEGLHKKLWTSKVVEVLILGIPKFLRSLEKNDIWV
jgi:hypothetical protein